MNWIGTSGFAYKEWKGIFYPEKIKAREMLSFYASKLAAVEINSTFYRMPDPSVLAAWMAQVPAEFRFVLKLNKAITHSARLKDIAQSLGAFVDRAVVMTPKLGCLFFQLPPNLKVDLGRLSDCLGLLPKGSRAAFEFRHDSWFNDEVYELLSAHNQALCIAESEDLHTPFVATADWGYLRLRELDYKAGELQTYADRINKQKWKESFIFFKHEDGGLGSRFALSLRALLAP